MVENLSYQILSCPLIQSYHYFWKMYVSIHVCYVDRSCLLGAVYLLSAAASAALRCVNAALTYAAATVAKIKE